MSEVGLSPAECDLLCAAYGSQPEAGVAWARWRDAVDWEGHLAPQEFALLPAVCRNLQRHAIEDALLPRFKGILRQSWLLHQQRGAALADTSEACAREGVRLVVMPPTWTWLVDATTVSYSGQAVHVVAFDAPWDAALELLLRSGWESERIEVPRRWLAGYACAAGGILVRRGEQRLWLGCKLPPAFDERDDEVRERVRPWPVSGRRIHGLDPTDACELILRRGEEDGWLAGCAGVLAVVAAGQEVRWEQLRQAFARWGLPSCAGTALRQAEPCFREWGIPTDLWRYATEVGEPGAAATGWAARARQDWGVYRRAWGRAYRFPQAMRQLPGYLMGRWNADSPLQWVAGAAAWLGYDRRRRS